MILNFSTELPDGTPTNFADKILAGNKIHTIRKGNRWKAGDLIHFSTGSRTKQYSNFYQTTCTSTQQIEMWLSDPGLTFIIDHDPIRLWSTVDRKYLLAKNSGLSWSQLEGFYVNAHNLNEQSFLGQIIHWTDFRY
jgi:hypothetical protein